MVNIPVRDIVETTKHQIERERAIQEPRPESDIHERGLVCHAHAVSKSTCKPKGRPGSPQNLSELTAPDLDSS